MIRLNVWLLLVAAMLATACKREGASHAHPNESEEPSTHFTLWTNGYEIFAEHPLPVIGQSAEFIIHVSDLATGLPVRSPLRLKFDSANGLIAETAITPARPGFYTPDVTFPRAGKWVPTLTIATNTLILPTITVYGTAEETRKVETPPSPEGISFLKEQQWKIQTKTELTSTSAVIETLPLLGTVVPKPGTMASVIPPVSGRLLLPPDKPLPTPGQKVEAGELLVILQPNFSEQAARILQAEAEANRARAALNFAKLNLERTRRLASSEAKSSRELQEAEFAFQQAESLYQSAVALQNTFKTIGAGTNLSVIELRAPISGVIGSVVGNLGGPIKPDQVLVTILNSQTVWIESVVPQSTLRQMDKNPKGFLSSGEELKFISLGQQLDPATRSVFIRFETENPANPLLIGQTVPLLVQSRHSTNSIAVPETAIVEEDGRSVAFVQLGGETFEKRDVLTGLRGNALVQIIEGLSEGERVVTDGAYAVRLASVSSVIPAHDHSH